MGIILNGMPKKFFTSEEERELWIKLNAKSIQYFNLQVNNQESELGDINTPYTPMWISNNQLKYDEENKNEPRYSLEELSSLSMSELVKLCRKKHREWVKKYFPEFLDQEEDLM